MSDNNTISEELKERLEKFYEKPLDEIFVENTSEVCTNEPVGDEVW